MKKTLSIVLALALVLSCCSFAMAESTEEASYTYNTALSDFPTNWSALQNQTSTDSEILDYISAQFYTFDYKDMDDPEAGYKMTPDLASGDPIDVTADYVGDKWGIAEGETARAWKIPLRENLAWQDGTPITSADFIESYKRLIDPKAANYRADGLWTGNMVVMGAEAYGKAGTSAETTFGTLISLEGTDMEGFLAAHGEEKGYINWANSYGDTYDFTNKAWTGAAEDAWVETPLTVAELYTFFTAGEGSAYANWADTATKMEWAYDELAVMYTYPEADWENVGMLADGDYAIVFIISEPLEGFYLYYSLTSCYLVNVDLYDKCASEEGGVYTNTYGTSVETTMSYGPFMLTSFQSDKEFVLEKNPYYYGWELPEFEGSYQITKWVVTCVKEASTRLEMFLNGQLDIYGLNKDDMADYSTSDYTYYSEGDSIYNMVFNPDLEALTANQAAAGENINKTILTVKEFRMAMSMAMNRAEFCLATSPTNGPAFALYGSQIVADPDNGIAYRSTDEAKQVIVDFWALGDEIGEGKLYATVDDALESISGYNLEMAKEYFDKAYDIAIESGLMDEDDVVEIIVGTPNLSSAFYNAGYDYIVNNYTEAVKGTKLEGKLTFTRDGTLGNGFADALRANNVDMLFGVGWTGSTFDPYNLLQVYVSPNYQYDSSWDATAVDMAVELDGVSYTASVYDWYLFCNGKTVTVVNADGAEVSLTAADNSQKIIVLAACENVILQNYNNIPLMNASSAALKGMKIEYFTEDQVFPMGRGGVKWMTFNYTDAEWADYVAEQGGTLNYK